VIVQAAPPLHFPWIAERTGCALSPSFRAIEAVDEKHRIRGMVGFDHWMGNSAEMHIALDAPAALRALLQPAFDYLFNQAGKDVAIGIVPAHNAKALAFDKRIGFRELCRIKDGWAKGDDVVVLEMRREECRFLQEKYA
jgi:RimJ/RimL family protein N-acetyltransferase